MKVILRFYAIFLMVLPSAVLSAPCADNHYDIDQQSAVNALGALNCTIVTGNLSISNSSDVVDLNALSSLVEVRGDLAVHANSNLANLDGLLNIAVVEGSLTISSNPLIFNIDGLISVTRVGGNLTIKSNDKLTNLDGLANVGSVDGELDISGNNALANLDGLVKLSTVLGNPASGSYCYNVPSNVICDPDADGRVNPGGNMDFWADKTWGFENTPIPNGKVVAYPFLANAGPANGEGRIIFSNNMPDLRATDYYWKGWFSQTPGGPTLNDGNNYCQRYSPNPNPQEMRWSQASVPDRFACDLGSGERVLYFNMGVGCYEEVLADKPLSERNCTVGEPFPGIGGYGAYYVKVYPR